MNSMRFNIPKLKALKNERFTIVDKPGILLLFRLVLKVGLVHLIYTEKTSWYHSVAEQVRRKTVCLSRGTQHFGAVVRPLRENCSVRVSVLLIPSD